MNDRTRGGRTLARWKGPNGLRLKVLRRDGGRCQFQLHGCTGKATQVHIAPILGGDHTKATMDTAVAVCAHCHGRVDGLRARRRRMWVADDEGAVTTPTVVLKPNRFLTALGRRSRPMDA
jgi:5-methylcytosine-specific restriction endonuclease McrA